MTLSHKKRTIKRARLELFQELSNEFTTEVAVVDAEQYTKYHWSFARILPEGHWSDPVQAYPTTLRIVTLDGRTINCLTVPDMFTKIKQELWNDPA
jgi:hypothetical protein